MRLVDADGIKEFAAYYTELDGELLTDREKYLVECVCTKISTLMPAACDVDRAVELLGDLHNHACSPAGWVTEEQQPVYAFFRDQLKDILDVMEGGGGSGQSIADPV